MSQEARIEELHKGGFMRRLVRRACFAAFGVTAFVNLADPWNVTNLIFGILTGLFFGFVCRRFLAGLLGLFNRDLKSTHGKKIATLAVERGMVFMVPFSVMALAASFFMGWSLTGGFVSAGLMTAGAMSAVEIGRFKGKPALKNTILSSVAAWCFSTLWLFAAPILGKIPPYLDGGVTLLLSLKDQFMK